MRAAFQGTKGSAVRGGRRRLCHRTTEAILPRAQARRFLKREITDVQSIQRIRTSFELEHRCRFGMGPCGLPCWSATRAALNIATDAASRGAERSASATDAGARGAGSSDPAALRAHFHA